MRALFGATGLSINVGDEDKQKNKLECVIEDYKNPKIFLYIIDSVDKNDGLEELGFHMQCWPPNVSARNSTKIYIYLSKERWHKLTNEYDSEARGGFFASRCKYDRCHFNYWSGFL
ncbi:MAG: hypothetical protein KJ646_00180 [Nanoarchaeota archaeon]|nr:hypothetical protein [Nanoarchaeota archaeon]MBU4116543.1 hypothetical protein [Nanoarchaeota archaeon]